MKLTIRQCAFAAPLLCIFILVLSSFVPTKTNSHANGGGIADGRIHFSFTAVEQKDGAVVGFIQYGDDSYSVSCATWTGKSVILFTTDHHAFYISDNGKPSSPDWISDPIQAQCGDPVNSSDFFGLHYVTSGNIQVKE